MKKKMDDLFEMMVHAGDKETDESSIDNSMADAVAASMPIRNLVTFGLCSKEEIQKKLDEYNSLNNDR